MKRTTQKQLEVMVENCNRIAPQKGRKYAIEYAYGRPRLVLRWDNGCCSDVSPRLSKGELATWIWAFQAGIEAAHNSK